MPLDLFDAAVRFLTDLYAAGTDNGMNPGAIGLGGLGGAAAGGGAASGGDGDDDHDRRDRGDRGFRYTNGDGSIYDGTSTDSTRLGSAPNGGRLIYDQIARDAGGNPTHYHVNVPGGASGWIPAGNTSDTRPTAPPPPRPSVVIDSGVDLARSASAQTAGSRG